MAYLLDSFHRSGIFGPAIAAAFVGLLVVGLIVIVRAGRRKPVGIFLVLAFLPLLIGLAGTIVGYGAVQMEIRKARSMGITALPHDIAHGRAQSRRPLYMGAAASAPLVLIGLIGYAVKSPRPGPRTSRFHHVDTN